MPIETTNPAPSGALSGAPVSVGVTTERGALPNLEPSPKFLYFHHPAAWYVATTEEGAELLPLLSQCAVEPGVGRVDRHGDPAGLIGHKTARGWTLIPESAANGHTPDGAPGYVRAYPGQRGTMHMSAWTTVRVLAGRPTLISDEAAYHRWLRSLVERGIIAPCAPEIAEAKLDAARDTLGRAVQRDGASTPGSTAHRLAETAKGNVEALEAIVSGAAPAPKAKKAPKAKEAANG